MRHQFLLAAAMLAASTVTTMAQILPAPQTTGGRPLMDMMAQRQSLRDIDPNSTVSRQDLSNILWAAWGITHDGKHTVATAMNRQELILYVITATEISRFNPETNTLTVVNRGDFRNVVGRQDFAKTAPLNIALVVDTNKQARTEFQAYTTGAASQNIYLYCAQAGLKTVVRAMLNDAELSKAMKLPENELLLYVQTVGK
ncbi:MAG: nitroreductase family protein [Muribaculaceae bacterium]|nr:nitroreductase family protein [Muribaculaceae bacterium]